MYGIVEQSEGYIWVYSEPGHGSCFKTYLPRVDQPAQALPNPAIEISAIRGTQCILLVEDDRMVRDLAHSVLSNCGYAVMAPDRIENLKSMCHEYASRVDLLLTDVVMPGFSGRDLARYLTSLRPDIRVCTCPVTPITRIVHKGLLDPGIWFLAKPFTPAPRSPPRFVKCSTIQGKRHSSTAPPDHGGFSPRIVRKTTRV